MKFKKIKERKIVKILDERKFKEIKKENENQEETSESESENDIQESNGFSSGNRTAPVLASSGESQLESTAESWQASSSNTQPARRMENAPAVQENPYTARYTNYSNSYETARERENWRTARIQAQRQEIGIGLVLRDVPQVQRTWDAPNRDARDIQEQVRPTDKKYEPAEDRMKEDRTFAARRRRMMG